MSRVLHMTIDIRGALDMPRGATRRMLRRSDGSIPTYEEVRVWLLDRLQEGKRRLPVGEPCEGFSYETGCPGHEEPPT